MYIIYAIASINTPFYTHIIPEPVSKKYGFRDPDPTLIPFLRYRYNIGIYTGRVPT